MSNTKSDGSEIKWGCGCLFNMLVGWYFIDYLIAFWGTSLNFSDKLMDMPFIVRWILGAFFGTVAFVVSIATWFISLFWTP